METKVQPETYFEKAGQGHEGIVRCHHCRRLVTWDQIQTGSCVCGSRKVDHIKSITDKELVDIFRGRIDFPMREEFLASFDYPGRADGSATLEAVVEQMERELQTREADHV